MQNGGPQQHIECHHVTRIILQDPVANTTILASDTPDFWRLVTLEAILIRELDIAFSRPTNSGVGSLFVRVRRLTFATSIICIQYE